MNAEGLNLLKEFEGFRSKAYPDPATGGAPWTIGYGFTKGVKRGDTITPAEAEKRLIEEVQSYEAEVRRVCPRGAENQISAMTSLCYNIGGGNFAKSSVARFHNEGKHALAADAFLMWNKAAGKVMAGLSRRRRAERELYLKPVTRELARITIPMTEVQEWQRQHGLVADGIIGPDTWGALIHG